MSRVDREDNLPTQDTLNDLLTYDGETGKLFWKPRPVETFRSIGRAKSWNEKFAGAEAFTARNHGYAVGRVFDELHSAHRVVWKMTHGYEPPEVDHINGDRADNRLSNLRACSRKANGRNLAARSSSASGITGVRQLPSGKWQAYIKVDGSQVGLGSYDQPAAAAVIRLIEQWKRGFSQMHGVRR